MLSVKQQKFCEYYVELGNATEAAKKAGYSVKTAYSIGTENLKKPEIRNFIDELTATEKNKRMASAEEVLEFFAEVMRNENEMTKNRLKAAENLAKRYGLDCRENADETEDKLYRGEELIQALQNRKIEGVDDANGEDE